MRKGITPVVAIVLLIGLTVSAAGTVYFYVNSATGTINPETNMGQDLHVDFQSCWQDGTSYKYSIRNVNDKAFNSSRVDVFINSQPRQNYDFSQVIVDSQETIQLQVMNVNSGDRLKIMLGETSTEYTCRN